MARWIPWHFAVAYIGMGENYKALLGLLKAYREHSSSLTALKVDPIYDPLRGEPRFQELLAALGWHSNPAAGRACVPLTKAF